MFTLNRMEKNYAFLYGYDLRETRQLIGSSRAWSSLYPLAVDR